MKKEELEIRLDKEDIPRYYYNIVPDLPGTLEPPISPETRSPIGPDDLAPLFPRELIRQEVSTERFIPIPDKVREIYAQFRPTPIYRAKRLEESIGTEAKIYYKYEGVSPPGSHKTNTAIAQAYYNFKEGVEKLITETGAGQWGSALSYATSLFGMELEVFMVRVSYDGKPHRKTMMQLFNDRATVYASPSMKTDFGEKMLHEEPNHPGSLGIAIGEAIERTVKSEAKYSLGSVLNHVLIHQSIIGQEAKIQMEKIDETPDYIIGCVGGGSNFAGLAYPFVHDKLRKKNNTEIIAVESEAAPKMTRGSVQYDFGDSGKMTPLLKMHTIGSDFVPPPVHAGGLRYHGLAPSISLLLQQEVIKASAYSQLKVFDAARRFIQSEGIIPAPESSHAIAQTIDIARDPNTDEETTILFNLSGHGYLDLIGYQEYLNGTLNEEIASTSEINKALARISLE